MRKGAKTSNEASERSRPAKVLGEGILSIPLIARLTKPPRRLSIESYFRMLNPHSILTEEDLSSIRGRYGFLNEVQLRLLFLNERADTVSEGCICMYMIYFECGLRLPIPPFLIQSMHHYQLAISQLMPNGMGVFLGMIVITEEAGVELSVDDILALYYPQENSKDRMNEKSLGALANAFYPLWGHLSKELKKPPPKALLFEQKLEQLLAQPCREWDEINVPERLRASSLWKDFIELKTGIIKRIPPWVDWPFVIRGALRRLFGTPLFIEPLSDEEALIAELALDTMNVDFPNPKDLLAKKKAQKEAAKAAATEKGAQANRMTEPPPLPVIESSLEPPTMHVQSPGKKQKANEKPKRKILAKKKKMSNASTSETDVDLRSSKECGEKLLDIERKFEDVKASANELIAELQTVNQSVKEGTDMMKVMVDRYDEATVKIKTLEESLQQKEADNSVLARIIDAYERATLKARYDLLKEYKQGLLVDADVEEEIELYEDSLAEAGASSSAPVDVDVPVLNEPEPAEVEPPSNVDPLEDRETRQ
ncbi:hypothetical protein TIFTF001_016757 [Ficus carica]|uniref:Transposase (putative) gypsy type domain-containing protein n=1 Tax=Ficus carica TaxID=3494 RepID=A0AA88AK40_FICCA|nr:hypothetical protein TIFTF001_016757 [Ficus carica]